MDNSNQKDYFLTILKLTRKIDAKHQGKGFGKETVKLVIEDIRAIKEERHHTITLSYEPENIHAKRIYEKMGFTEVEGLIIGGEQVSRFTF